MKLLLCYYLMLIFLMGFLGAVKFRCDYTYSNIGWIKYHELPATWNDARLRCQSEGAMLASPTSPELKKTMVQAIRHLDIFTGIHSTFSPGSYYSINGIPLDFQSHLTWVDNEPDNKHNAERCISMNVDGKISDVNCNVPHPYICHKINSLQSTNICGTPDPEYYFETRTNKCYKFHPIRRTFQRAHFVCSAEGGHLAIINSETESHVIRDLFARYPPAKITGTFFKDIAIIGFHNYGESQDWTTIHGQSLREAGFDKFDPGQPDNATTGECCGSVFRSGLLNDLWCGEHYPFICEKDPAYPPVCDNNSN